MESKAAWVAFVAAMITLSVNIVVGYVERKETQERVLIDHRRQALFMALEVIDHVYANEPIGGNPPSHPHQWDLQKAHDAMNGILVYCDKPDQTLAVFKRALGMYNPTKEKPPGIDVASLDAFRAEVARELGLPTAYKGNPDYIWISNLSGGKVKE